MTISQIKKIVSETPIGKMKIIKTKCRPPEKSNEILIAKVGGKKWYCERPRYHWSILDRSFIAKTYASEAKRIFPDKNIISGFFDQRGLFWTSYELSSLFLLPYYLEKPLEYLQIMSHHMVDVQKVIKILQEVHKDLDKNEKLVLNVKRLAKAYSLFYLYSSTLFFVFDELLYQFKLFLFKYFDKKTANIYLTKFLQAEITREVLEKKYGEKLVIERPDSRGVLYASGTKPMVYYRRPRFFHEFSDDMNILEILVKKNLKSQELKKFFAFRQLVPVAVQVNEEAQYVESQMLSSHTSYIIKMIVKKLKIEIDDLEKLTYQKITKLLMR